MLRPGRFFWKLFLTNALLMAVVLAVCTRLIVSEVEALYEEDLSARLEAQADQIRFQFRDRYAPEHAAALDAAAKELGGLEFAQVRVTIIGPDGAVWADSDAAPGQMENHLDRPEVGQALANGVGRSERFSRSVGRDMKYIAVRVGPAEQPQAVVRVSMARAGIEARASGHRRLIWMFAGLGLVAILLVALISASVWSEPIRRISDLARSLSRGNLAARAEVSGSDEIAEMASYLNQMRENLATQLQTIDLQRRNLDYLIRSLTEGVILADAEGRIVLMNPAAVRLLRVSGGDGSVAARFRRDGVWSGDAFVGQSVRSYIASPELRELLLEPVRAFAAARDPNDAGADRAPRDDCSREIRLTVDSPAGPISLLARSSALDLAGADASTVGGKPGRLVVLTDITELTRTIQIKTDFVANASHELRTPLTAIRGSVETLLHMNLRDDADAAANFVRMIDRHSARLTDIVADLLDLSRLEAPGAQFPPTAVRVRDLLEETHARFAEPIAARRIEWRVDCPAACESIVVSPQLFRLVLDNLVENAVKFTEPGGFVAVICSRGRGEYRLSVADNGCGIAPEEQARVFERFYQVERARSGASGRTAALRGTGLGLSIVRHAVLAMKGRVDLMSALGHGTTVTVSIPQPD